MCYNKTMKRGFTLIELMVVILILGVLTGLAVPRYLQSQKELSNVFCTNIVTLTKVLEEYNAVHFKYPNNLNVLQNQLQYIPKNPFTGYPMLDSTFDSGIVYITNSDGYLIFVTQHDENEQIIDCNVSGVLSGMPFYRTYNLVLGDNMTATTNLQFPVYYNGMQYTYKVTNTEMLKNIGMELFVEDLTTNTSTEFTAVLSYNDTTTTASYSTFNTAIGQYTGFYFGQNTDPGYNIMQMSLYYNGQRLSNSEVFYSNIPVELTVEPIALTLTSTGQQLQIRYRVNISDASFRSFLSTNINRVRLYYGNYANMGGFYEIKESSSIPITQNVLNGAWETTTVNIPYDVYMRGKQLGYSWGFKLGFVNNMPSNQIFVPYRDYTPIACYFVHVFQVVT